MKKGILASILMICLMTASTGSVYADNVFVDNITEYLVDNGLPSELLEGKSENYIAGMYNKLYDVDFIYHGSETVTLPKVHESDVNPMEILHGTELELTVAQISNVSYDATVGRNRVNEVYIYVEYEWAIGNPYIRKEDVITVNWDSNVFTYDADSFYAVDEKFVLSEGGWIETDTYSRPMELNLGELGYIANLKYTERMLGQVINASQCRGWAEFTLLPASPVDQVSVESAVSIDINYVHDRNPLPDIVGFLFDFKKIT